MDSISTDRWKDPSYQAFILLRAGFAALPIVFGLDKFTNLLTDWSMYLAPVVDDVAPIDTGRTMVIVGVVEILAGALVAITPRLGGYVVAGWLVAIMINLLTLPGYFDVAGRDLGLMVGALALTRLARGRELATQAADAQPVAARPTARPVATRQ
jgi:hypothetical protein